MKDEKMRVAPVIAVPVITVDGPAASGKGTVAAALAAQLGFHYLDSGKLYRAAALAVRAAPSTSPADTVAKLAAAPQELDALLRAPDLSSDETARAASVLAADAAVRTALIGLQRAARRAPGLVADGRDMGSVIFPDAVVKAYLTADLQTRAERRQLQLLEKHQIHVTIADVREELRQRDARDAARTESPLKQPPLAVYLDSTRLSASDAVKILLTKFHAAAALF